MFNVGTSSCLSYALSSFLRTLSLIVFFACLLTCLPFLSCKASAATTAAVWEPLLARLAKDGVSGPEVAALFAGLPPRPTQSPMGKKIVALYKKAFFPQRRIGKEDYYKGVVTAANAKRCQEFMKLHEGAFLRAQTRYQVPPEIAVALLFVETRLGTVLADVPENAFYTLASMAVCRDPMDISSYLPKMHGYEKRLSWMKKNMNARADWAYSEVKPLVTYMLANGISPADMPSSIYGAVGLCQFMPSNIARYGEDGNGDGRIDLFQIDDACVSLAKYLSKHGWRNGLSRDREHAVLMKYNHSKVYANTILALADQIRLLDRKAK
ncbi:MAG: lytic murein transglycosylase [Desulfovibrio sp.]|nr:lytic murein transglycosylase [Desulfovibrio sp.]